jgi:hypothetical protein
MGNNSMLYSTGYSVAHRMLDLVRQGFSNKATLSASPAAPAFQNEHRVGLTSPAILLAPVEGEPGGGRHLQAGERLHRHKARCRTICNLIVRSILRARLRRFDDQAIDECLQVAI